MTPNYYYCANVCTRMHLFPACAFVRRNILYSRHRFHLNIHILYIIYPRRISNACYDCNMKFIWKYIWNSLFCNFGGHFGGCGINDEVSQWMDNVQNAGLGDEDDIASASGTDEKRKSKTPKKFVDAKMLKRNKLMDATEFFKDDLKYPHMKYTKEANLKDSSASSTGDIDDDDAEEWHRRSHARAKRAARPKEDNRNTCSLYIQTDPLIWRHIREGIADVSNPNTSCLKIEIYVVCFFSQFCGICSTIVVARLKSMRKLAKKFYR